jgi:hypothetical protein
LHSAAARRPAIRARTASLGEPPRSRAAKRMQVFCRAYVAAAATRALDQKGTPDRAQMTPRQDRAPPATSAVTSSLRSRPEAHNVLVSGSCWQCGTEVVDQIREACGARRLHSQRFSVAGVVHPPTSDGDDGHPRGRDDARDACRNERELRRHRNGRSRLARERLSRVRTSKRHRRRRRVDQCRRHRERAKHDPRPQPRPARNPPRRRGTRPAPCSTISSREPRCPRRRLTGADVA